MSPVQGILLLTSALFCIGVFGLLTRKNAIGILLSVELMMNAVNINLVAFSHFSGKPDGLVFTVFVIALAVAEVVIGLALIILLYRWRKHVAVDAADELRH
jgi:NADH-quinone oxidoreductase subunit K